MLKEQQYAEIKRMEEFEFQEELKYIKQQKPRVLRADLNERALVYEQLIQDLGEKRRQDRL